MLWMLNPLLQDFPRHLPIYNLLVFRRELLVFRIDLLVFMVVYSLTMPSSSSLRRIFCSRSFNPISLSRFSRSWTRLSKDDKTSTLEFDTILLDYRLVFI
jgi:hypothetical protein